MRSYIEALWSKSYFMHPNYWVMQLKSPSTSFKSFYYIVTLMSCQHQINSIFINSISFQASTKTFLFCVSKNFFDVFSSFWFTTKKENSNKNKNNSVKYDNMYVRKIDKKNTRRMKIEFPSVSLSCTCSSTSKKKYIYAKG